MSADQISTVPTALAEDAEDEINLGEILATLLENKWLIAAVTGLSIFIGGFALFVATPVYQVDGLLQIDEKSQGFDLKQLDAMLSSTTKADTEVEIITSRMILEPMATRLKLEIQATPAYMPVIGAAIARRYSGAGIAEPLFSNSKYAWGGEHIQVETLTVPESLLGKPLTLIAGANGAYQLLDDDDNPLLKGVVGTPAAGKGVALFVSQLQARPGTQFNLSRMKMADALQDLKDRLVIKERGKDTGIVGTTLTGTDATLIKTVLDEIQTSYMRQNVEYRSAEAANQLKFLKTQLPTLKSQLDKAEAAYNSYRQSRGSLDLTIETQAVLASQVDVDKELVKLQQERENMRSLFTPEHPQMQAMDAKMAILKAKRKQFDASVSKLPATQQEVIRLKRDVDVATGLYTTLLNTAQELSVSKAGTVGDVRIVDPAMLASKPISPKPALILAVSLVLGLLLSVVLVWVMRSLRVMVEDPDKIEKQIGLPVYATIPHSKTEDALARDIKTGKKKGELLSIDYPEDDAVESLRSLRTTIHFALLDADKGSLLITGPSPGIGKSFISKNLGAVLAQSGKRVAIVDADLRKGHIHREFDMQREVGVSEFVSGTASLSEIVKPTKVPGLSVITTGQRPPNPSELLMHHHFGELLEQLGDLFDILIVDAPPILAVSDAAIIGRHTGATLMVARSGMHPIREIEQAVKRLNQAGVQVKGFVFNDMDTVRQKYRYGYHGYVYSYSYKKN
jgi:tyrosine-protein kinase Etk/Wzc